MIIFNNKVVTYNHKWINGGGSPEPYYPNPLKLKSRTFQVDGTYTLEQLKEDFDCYYNMPTGAGLFTSVNVTSYERVDVIVIEGDIARIVPRWNVTIDFPWWFSNNEVMLDNQGKSINGQLITPSSSPRRLYHCYGMNLSEVYDMRRIGDWFTSIDYCYAPDLITPDNTSVSLYYTSTFSIDEDNYYHLRYMARSPEGSWREYDLKLYKDDDRYLESWEGTYSGARYYYYYIGQFFGESPATYIKLIIGPYLSTLSRCFYPCHNLETAIIEAPNGCYVTNMESAYHTDSGTLSKVVIPDTYHVTNMKEMLSNNWRDLEECPAFDTSNVTNIENMFYNCAHLKEIPNLTFGKVVNAGGAFNGTYNADTGILRAYNNLSSQTTPPSIHVGTFYNCGVDSVTGSAEVAQIPSDWKGDPDE